MGNDEVNYYLPIIKIFIINNRYSQRLRQAHDVKFCIFIFIIFTHNPHNIIYYIL